MVWKRNLSDDEYNRLTLTDKLAYTRALQRDDFREPVDQAVVNDWRAGRRDGPKPAAVVEQERQEAKAAAARAVEQREAQRAAAAAAAAERAKTAPRLRSFSDIPVGGGWMPREGG